MDHKGVAEKQSQVEVTRGMDFKFALEKVWKAFEELKSFANIPLLSNDDLTLECYKFSDFVDYWKTLGSPEINFHFDGEIKQSEIYFNFDLSRDIGFHVCFSECQNEINHKTLTKTND